MKTRSLQRVSLIFKRPVSALPKLTTPCQMESPIKATVASEVFSEYPQKSLRKRKAAVLQAQPASSDSELSPLSDDEPVVAEKPAKKKRKVATKTMVVADEACFAAAGDAATPVKMTRRKRKVKAAAAEEDIAEYTQGNQMPRQRKRKPRVVEPAVYDIPDVERKETTFKGNMHPRVSALLLIGHLHFISGRLGYARFSHPPYLIGDADISMARPV